MVAMVAGCKSSQGSHDESAHDFEIHIHGEVAWVTVFVDTTVKVDNDAARALTKNNHPNEREWNTHAVETEVLLKTPHGWKIVLGHTSILPKER